MPTSPPLYALSVHSVWAWLIVNGLKRFENREWIPTNPARRQIEKATAGGAWFDLLIHASRCQRRDYAQAFALVCLINGVRSRKGLAPIELPTFEQLQHGGIIGRVTVLRWCKERIEDPFSTTSGLLLANASPLPFTPCKGSLGFFRPKYATL